ncbi:MAG: hypothetical protein KVP17_004729 [Porospora cf. gigantea B]|nr:MAG: hypothetical protein KVP17_004729 [Porospora cf. gigantea B]
MTILPPIIFDSGFSLKGQKAKEFFDNFGTVLWFALLSTFLSFLVVGAMMYCAGVVHLLGGAWSVREAFAFGALISATDPVSVISLFKNNPVLPLLETLVSGESLMNDALSIVLYRTIAYTEEGATFLGLVVRFVTVVASSVLIGVVVGLTSTALARYTVYARDERASLEFSLLLLFPWISYLLSDGLGNSGIVSILFCAVVMAQYTVPLLSSTVQESASAVSASASLFAESAAFVFLGLGEFSLRQSMLSVRLVVSTIVVVSFARVVSVWVTTLLVNRLVREHNPITSEVQSALIISGLRGSCAFALAMHARHDFGGSGGSAIVSATLVYSIFTIMIVGPASYPCFHALRVFISPEDRQNLSQDSHVADVQLSGRLKLALMKVDDILRVWLLPAEDTIEPEHHCQSESAIGAARGSLLPVYGDVTIELR